MKLLCQRVKYAKCIIDEKIFSEIDEGLLILVGITHEDTYDDVTYLVKKCANLRIFEDENHKMNLSVKDINGKILSVSQFTLYANTVKGNRPSFTNAANPEKASKLDDEFNRLLSLEIPVQTGVFGSFMQLEFINDGPVTIIMDSNDRQK